MTSNLQPDDRLGDFTADGRIVTLTAMAALIGVISAFVALALLRLIGFFTHLFYYHAIDSGLVSPAGNRLGVWALLVPILGGLLVGLMARHGSERIRGHGQAFHLSSGERKTLLVAGAAGGMAAWSARRWPRARCACPCSARDPSFRWRHTPR